MTGRPLGLAALLCGLAGCVLPTAGDSLPRDPAPTWFWGIQKACKRDPYLSSAVEKRIYQMSGPTGGEVRRLLPGPTIQNGTPETAAVELRRACGKGDATDGVLIGGQVEERAPRLTLMRLWRYDLRSNELSYRDHYCRGCDIARTLATQAVYLLESPDPSATAASPVPTFCAAPVGWGAPASPTAGEPERVVLTLRGGERSLRSAVEDAVKQELFLGGREVLPVESPRLPGEAAHQATATAGRLLGLRLGAGPRAPRATWALAIELAADGQVELGVAGRGHDPTAPLGASTSLSCPRCDPAALAQRVARAAAAALDQAVAGELASYGDVQGGLTIAPLLPSVRTALCGPAAARCEGSGALRLDSDSRLFPFYDPQCGERLGTTNPP